MISARRAMQAGACLLMGTLVVVPLGALDAPRARTEPVQELTAEESLGRLLFWDPILSGDRDVACATCHHPDFAWADGRALSLGAGSVGLGPDRVDESDGAIPVVRRNSQTILNSVFNGVADRGRRGRGRGRGPRGGAPFDGTVASVNLGNAPMFWDNRVRSLETQALEPIKALEEMRGANVEESAAVPLALERLRANPEYVAHFEAVYGEGATITAEQSVSWPGPFSRSTFSML